MKTNCILATILFFLFTSPVFSETKITSAQHSTLQSYTGEMYDLHYHRLALELDPAVSYIKGCITSEMTVKAGSVSLTFDLSNVLSVDSIIYHQVNIGGAYTHLDNLLTIPIPLVTVTQKDSIKVYYSGTPTRGLSFLVQYGTTIPLAFTDSEPYDAHNWWPCKQSLNDKIDSIDFVIKTPSQYKVAANGVLYAEINQGAFTTAHWKHRYPIATYLIAFAVSDYTIYSDYVLLSSGRNLEVLNYVFPSGEQAARDGTQLLIPVMELYDSLFGPYPFQKEKYGHVEAPTGMENQTMSFVGNFNLGLMAHELAHQWFGNKVTCNSWHDLWLNEGFATYAAMIAVEAGLDPDPFILSLRPSLINYVTAFPGSKVYASDTSNFSSLFNLGVYNKAAMVIHMLRCRVGDQAFFRALRYYLADPHQKYAFGKVSVLKNYLESTSGQDLSLFFTEWIYESGFPAVQLAWNQIQDHTLYLYMPQVQSTSVPFYHDLPIHISFRGAAQEVYDTTFYMEEGHEYAMFNPGFTVTEIKFDTLKNVLAVYSEYVDPTLELVSAVMTSIESNPTNQTLIPVSLTFGEMMMGFDVSDLSVSGATLQNFQGDGMHYTFNLVPLSSGKISVILLSNKVVSINNKKNAGAVFYIRYSETADVITIPQETNSIQIYPVPTYSTLNIVSATKRIERYELVDMIGQQVFAHHADQWQVQCDVSFLNSGMYVLLVWTEDNGFFKEVVVKK